MDSQPTPIPAARAASLASNVAAGQAKVARDASLAAARKRLSGLRDELAQLIQNLVDNAIKYSRPNTTVEIALTRTETPPSMAKAAPHGVLRIAVKDQGKGIPREHLPRLTERFYRVDAARSHALGGTGLGLAIVKHITNHHRGLLSIDSTLGEGSTFAVQIPAANPNDARSLLSPRSSRTN